MAEMGWHELEEGMPTLETEEERDQWVTVLLGVDIEEEAALAALVKDDEGNMVVRFRYKDGSEEVYDVAVRRYMQVVPPVSEREGN